MRVIGLTEVANRSRAEEFNCAFKVLARRLEKAVVKQSHSQCRMGSQEKLVRARRRGQLGNEFSLMIQSGESRFAINSLGRVLEARPEAGLTTIVNDQLWASQVDGGLNNFPIAGSPSRIAHF